MGLLTDAGAHHARPHYAILIWCTTMNKKEQDPKERKPLDAKDPAAEDHEGEDGYGSVDDDERPTIDKKKVISNPG